MYSNILPQKYKVNVSIFFQKFNTVFFVFINFTFGLTSSSIEYELVSIEYVYWLVAPVSQILPLIMHFTFYPIGMQIG